MEYLSYYFDWCRVFLDFAPRHRFVRFSTAVTPVEITRCVDEYRKISTVSLRKQTMIDYQRLMDI